jgi:hypothetical protein
MEDGPTFQALAVICKQLGASSALWLLACTSKSLRRELMRLVEDYLAKHHDGNRLHACLDCGRKEVAEDYDKIVKRGFEGVELATRCFNVARRIITMFGVCDNDLAEWGEFGNRFHLLSLIATSPSGHKHLPMLQAEDRYEFRLLVYSRTPAAIDRFVAEAKAAAEAKNAKAAAEAKAGAATATAPLP